MEIWWLDGGDSHGQFVMEISFANGGVSFLKNKTRAGILANYERFWAVNPNVVGLVVRDPSNAVVASRCRMSEAA